MPQGDIFTLNDDGTVTLGWDGDPVRLMSLRRPNLGEIRSFVEGLISADAWLAEKGQNLATLLEDDNPYVQLYVRMFATLATAAPSGMVEMTAGELPVWLTDGGPFARIVKHWKTSPLDRGETAQVEALAKQLIAASSTTTPSS